MIDLSKVNELKLNDKVIDKIEDMSGVVIYEAWRELTKNGVPPLTLTNCKGEDLIDYKMYGNSVQEGTPTPDNPIEVESVGDKSKNLINFFDRSTQQTIGTKDCYVLNTEVGKSYTISFTFIDDSKIGTYFYFYKYDGTTRTFVAYLTTNIINNAIYTFTAEESQYLICRGGSYAMPQSEIDKFATFQVEEGSVATEYEPYGYKIPVKVGGKNLFSLSDLSHSYNAENINIKGNGFSFTNTQTVNSSYVGSEVFLDVGTYKISGDVQLSDGKAGGWGIYDEKTEQYLVNNSSIGAVDGTFEVNEAKNYRIYFYCNYRSEAGTVAKYSNIVLAPVDDYKPVETYNIYLDEPLRKINDAADSIDFANQKVLRSINKYTFNNSFVDRGDNNYYSTSYYSKLNLDYNKPLMFDYLKGSTWTSNINTIMGGNAGCIVCVVDLTKYPDKDALNEFMNGKTVYFATTEPIEETIALPNIPTFKGTTILSVDTKTQPTNLEVIYKGK